MKRRRRITLLSAATAANSPPASATAGVALTYSPTPGVAPAEVALVVRSTAGSGVMSVTGRLWVLGAAGVWLPYGAGADGTKGTVNLQSAIGETGTNEIRHAELIAGLLAFRRAYFEVTAIAGTSTAVTAELEFVG